MWAYVLWAFVRVGFSPTFVLRDPELGGQKQRHIWNTRPHIDYSLCNFQGAAVTIKGSLLMNLPIIKRFCRYAHALSRDPM